MLHSTNFIGNDISISDTFNWFASVNPFRVSGLSPSKKNQEKLAGLYVGNPKRETARPTAELLLAAFKEITLLLIEVKNEVLCPLECYAHPYSSVFLFSLGSRLLFTLNLVVNLLLLSSLFSNSRKNGRIGS
nr:hypothetical protein [Nostoc sp. 'Lobaria pulmonaria (5183) cyanobiont']